MKETKGWVAGDILLAAERARAERKDPVHEIACKLWISDEEARKLLQQAEGKRR